MDRRFRLNSDKLLPRWYLYVWCGLFTLAGVAFSAGLVVEIGPVGLLWLGLVLLVVFAVYRFAKGLWDPGRNYVELSGDSLYLVVFSPMTVVRQEIRYDEIENVIAPRKHHLLLFGSWPWHARWWQDHVDVELGSSLRAPMLMRPFWPWFRVLHLDTRQNEELAAELKQRVRAGTARAPIA